MREVPVGALAESMAHHIDGGAEAGALVPHGYELGAFAGGEQRSGLRAAMRIDLGGELGPLLRVDPIRQ